MDLLVALQRDTKPRQPFEAGSSALRSFASRAASIANHWDALNEIVAFTMIRSGDALPLKVTVFVSGLFMLVNASGVDNQETENLNGQESQLSRQPWRAFFVFP